MEFSNRMSYGDLKTEMTRILERKSRRLCVALNIELPRKATLGIKYSFIKDYFGEDEDEAFNKWLDIRNDYEHDNIDDFSRSEFIGDFEIVEGAFDQLLNEYETDEDLEADDYAYPSFSTDSHEVVIETDEDEPDYLLDALKFGIKAVACMFGVVLLLCLVIWFNQILHQPLLGNSGTNKDVQMNPKSQDLNKPPNKPVTPTSTQSNGQTPKDSIELYVGNIFNHVSSYIQFDSALLADVDNENVLAINAESKIASIFYEQGQKMLNKHPLIGTKMLMQSARYGCANGIDWCDQNYLEYSSLYSWINDDDLKQIETISKSR